MSDRPQFFCKYRAWKGAVERDRTTGECVERNRTKELLLKAEFYCQPPRFFDDPHDGLQGARPTGGPRDIDRFILNNLRGVPEIMRKHGLSSLTQLGSVKDSEDVAALARLARKNSRRKTRVLSLSADHANELMWSFYADNHKGICLCFDPAHPFFASARSVEYVDDPKTIPECNDDHPISDPLIYCKGRAWEWQHEWRIVWADEEPKLIAFPRDSLKAVVVGDWFLQPWFDDLTQTLIQGGYRVPIYQMERLPDSFAFQTVPLGEIGPKT